MQLVYSYCFSLSCSCKQICSSTCKQSLAKLLLKS